MSENKKTDVDAKSREFTRGVEAGLNSEDTKYWQAGYELGQGMSDNETKDPGTKIVQDEPDTAPLFIKDTLGGDAQDEKDKSAE